MEWPYFYIRDEPRPAPVHHWDYRLGRDDHALCGHPFDQPLEQTSFRPQSVCPKCEKLLPAWLSQLWEDWAAEQDREVEAVVAWYEKEVERLERKLRAARPEEEKRLERSMRARRRPSVRIVRGGLPGLGKRG
ncbi:hypothetical protein MLIT_46190 [Mycolicibacterium litorale]|uniref:Uncharacterized protein n=1 Tax=Mycolicibacterium litorale TaxID=758802 RepID=A0AAD1IT26_9MYCO|nr:hypothetical protein MLIT_46190 [Mycolicibacterium litorale]